MKLKAIKITNKSNVDIVLWHKPGFRWKSWCLVPHGSYKILDMPELNLMDPTQWKFSLDQYRERYSFERINEITYGLCTYQGIKDGATATTIL